MNSSGTENLLTSIRSGQLIGIQLIDLFKNTEIIEQIHEQAKDEIKSQIFSHRNRINKEIVILSLSLIAYQYYNGNFWNYVEEAYGSLFSVHPTRARAVISDILNSHSIKHYTDRNIDVVIMFTIVPLKFLPDFFDFLFDIYKTNFGCSLKYINLENEFNFIYSGLSSKMFSGRDSDVNFDVTGKTYQLIKATQRIIQHKEFYKEFIEYSVKHLKLIDQIYQDIKSNINIKNDDYPIFYHQAILGLINLISKKDDKSEFETQQRFSDDYLFDFCDNDIYLQVPNFRIDYVEGDVYDLYVYLDEKIVWSKNAVKIRYIFGGYKTVVDERIRLLMPFGNFRIEVKKNKKPISDLTIDFKRAYYVFDAEGKEIYRNKYGTGSFIIADRIIVDDSLKPTKLSHFEIGLLNVIDYKAIKTSNGELIEFGVKPKNGFVGNEYENVNVSTGNQNYPLFKDIYAFYFTCEYPHSKLKLILNDVEYKLIDNSDIETQNHLFTYRIKFDKLDLLNEPNRFLILNNQNNSILISTVLFIDRTFNIYEEGTQVKIESDRQLLELDGTQKITIQPNDTNINVSFIYNAKRYTYKIALPKYKILFEYLNLEKYEFNKYYWHKDLDNSKKLFVYGKKLNELSIKNQNGEILTKLVNRYEDFTNEIDITSIRNYTSNDYVYIYSMMDFEIKIFFKPQLFNKTEFITYDYDKGTVNFAPEGIGLDSIYLDIFDREDLVLSCSIDDNINYNFKPFKSYKYNLYTKNFLSKLNIHTAYIEPYKYSMFVGYSYPIIKMLHEPQIDSINYEMKEISTYKKFILFKEYLGKSTFKGRILFFEDTYKRELPFDIKIEIEGKIKYISTKLFVLHFDDEELLSLNEVQNDMFLGDYETFSYYKLPQIDFFIINIKGGKRYD